MILLDEVMPVLDGTSTLAALKKDPKTSDIPIVMVTVKNGNGYTRNLYDMGVHMHVVKPFNPEEIVDLCTRLVTTRADDRS